MLIPSIDLMGGKVVQLVQGAKKALEYENVDEWIERFRPYPIVQLIDLDAAMRQGENRNLISHICERIPCQVGGGIRTPEQAHEMLRDGAKKVIIGSALLRDDRVDTEAAKAFAHAAAAARLIFAVDARGGRVAIHGWKKGTDLTPAQMMHETESWCGAFLYTHIDTEGTMSGFPMGVLPELKAATKRRIIVAGGIKSIDEVQRLDEQGVDAVVGMAIYTGAMQQGIAANQPSLPA
jgi:phosphoribosylformimino-5-aminoimidazole carboxamide ribotide isomerase